ncbi:MAG: hypothetical protein HYZ42_08390 [Bacteroidetes bacterium]|nr:hypothetical protein [Bacteroidota bacterium]
MKEKVDFYYTEEGLMVFTEEWHLKRGHCCGSGCRHCPYNYEKVPEYLKVKLLEKLKTKQS